MEDRGCGSWLLEDKKDNKRHGKEKCCGLWPPAFPHSFRQGYNALLPCVQGTLVEIVDIV